MNTSSDAADSGVLAFPVVSFGMDDCRKTVSLTQVAIRCVTFGFGSVLTRGRVVVESGLCVVESDEV